MAAIPVAVPPELEQRLRRAADVYEIDLGLMCRAVLNDFVNQLDEDPRSRTRRRRPLELVEGGVR